MSLITRGLRFIEPQLASPADQPPEGKQSIHEIKHDGFRCQVLLERGRTRIFTRLSFSVTRISAGGCAFMVTSIPMNFLCCNLGVKSGEARGPTNEGAKRLPLERHIDDLTARDGIKFWMSDGECPVLCRVSHEALRDLAERVHFEGTDENVFEAYRELIEQVASDAYDAGTSVDNAGLILVTSEALARVGRSA